MAGRIAIITITVIAALGLPWVISWLWQWLPKQWDAWIMVAIAADAALMAVAAIWWLWWRLPRRQVARLSLKIRDPKARADVEDNFRKTVGQALGGAAVLIGAVAAYLQFTQQQQTAYQQILSQQQAAESGRKTSQDLLISNQVAKSFEQLAGEKIAMRLGGIYALEGVMNSSDEYRLPVLEALCAFARDGTREQTGEGPPAADIQAALTVIGRRKAGHGKVDLLGTNAPKANLVGANLSGANLNYTNLSGANLSGANLSGSTLLGAKLKSASLVAANLTKISPGDDLFDLAPQERLDLSNARLLRADLSGAKLNFANLNGADLRNAKLIGADLIGANLGHTDLSEANLSGFTRACHQLSQTTLATR